MMSAADPVGNGFVASLARPAETSRKLQHVARAGGKEIELLRVLPKLSRIAFWPMAAIPRTNCCAGSAEAAERFGMKFQPLVVATGEIERRLQQ
jgi:hypothetical protein